MTPAFPIEDYIAFYKDPSEFPYSLRGRRHYLLICRYPDGSEFIVRMYLYRPLLRYRWFSSARNRELELHRSPYYPRILEYIYYQILRPNAVELLEIQYGYYKRRLPYNFFFSLYCHIRHWYYLRFHHNKPKSRTTHPHPYNR